MKYYTLKKLLLAIILCSACLFFPSVTAQPTIERVTLFPAEPWAKSTITFNVTISSETTIDTVYIIVRECKTGFCYSDSLNQTMDSLGSNIYQTSLTLKHEDATYIEYLVNIQSEQTLYKSDVTIVNLSEKPSNGTNGTNGNGNHQNGNTNGNQTPGFEFLFVFIAIIILYIITRKRYR